MVYLLGAHDRAAFLEQNGQMSTQNLKLYLYESNLRVVDFRSSPQACAKTLFWPVPICQLDWVSFLLSSFVTFSRGVGRSRQTAAQITEKSARKPLKCQDVALEGLSQALANRISFRYYHEAI